MPSAQKIGWAQLRVGIMAAIALAILGALIFLLTGTKKLFTSDTIIYTYLPDSSALARGAPVRLNGLHIGEVKKVELSGDKSPRRTIRVHLEVEKDMLKEIPVDSQAAIAAENVLGSKFINITRGIAGQIVQPGGEIQAQDTADIDQVMRQGNTLLVQLQQILRRVDAIVSLVEVGKGSIGKLLVDEELYNRLLAMINDGQKITKAMSTPQGTIGKLLYDDALYADFRKSLARVDTVLSELQEGRGTAGKLLKDEALYTDIRSTLGEVRKLVEDLNAGKGTAGKLLKSEELHNQLRTSMAKLDTMIDRINSGQGTIGQLLVNRQLYDTLNGATGEMQQLLKDIRANPAKFLRIKLALF
jgi:phospholipid/cholesterol/gamma-HCH transport system substrate-binding protein